MIASRQTQTIKVRHDPPRWHLKHEGSKLCFLPSHTIQLRSSTRSIPAVTCALNGSTAICCKTQRPTCLLQYQRPLSTTTVKCPSYNTADDFMCFFGLAKCTARGEMCTAPGGLFISLASAYTYFVFSPKLHAIEDCTRQCGDASVVPTKESEADGCVASCVVTHPP